MRGGRLVLSTRIPSNKMHVRLCCVSARKQEIVRSRLILLYLNGLWFVQASKQPHANANPFRLARLHSTTQPAACEILLLSWSCRVVFAPYAQRFGPLFG
jgi:hypothetical protein